MYLVGKLEHWQEDAFSLPACRFNRFCSHLQPSFSIYTGASISVFPSPTLPSTSGVQLLMADGSTLTCSGSRISPLRFGTWNCSWRFQLAPVSVHILGADFLQHYDLSMNVRSKKVFSNSSSIGSRIDLSPSPVDSTTPMQAAFLTTPQCVSDLLEEFPDVLQSYGFTASPPCLKVRHHLLTNPGPPIFAKAIFHHGNIRECTLFYFSLGFSTTHGQEEGWRLEPLRRLPPFKHRHCA